MRLHEKAREARGMKLREALWLVHVAVKDADLETLAALCRDQRVGVRKTAAYGLISFLVNDAAADRDRLVGWWNDKIKTTLGVGSEDVPRDLPDLYGRARDKFMTLLTYHGVRNPESEWRRREHAFKVGLHQRVSRMTTT
jgi:hypothetical protein